ncbi:MAG: Peptidyl-tRNA hydrolase [Candidatus Heimdallarchaeota archaeon LC_3]|nr:MAG: Peptidyl-tRNA hydrolase [Candidatus Heimdallarchaeota archaeon LC_3]
MKIMSELSPIDQEQPEWFLLEKIKITKKSRKNSKNKEELDRIYSPGSWIRVFKWNKDYLTIEELLNQLIETFFGKDHFSDQKGSELIDDVKNNIIQVIKFGQNPLRNKEIDINISQIQITQQVDDLISLKLSLETFTTIDYPQQIENPAYSLLDFIKYNTFLCVKTKKLLEKKDYSIFVVIRRDLKLGKGKLGAQVAHGVVSLLFRRDKTDFSEKILQKSNPKIEIFSAPNVNILNEIEQKARMFNINESLIADAGHTQVESGTKTVIAIGPGPTHYLERFLDYWDGIKKLD